MVSYARIDGRFEGVIVSNGTLHVGPRGFIKSDLTGLAEVICEGKVQGSVTATRVVLRGKAVVVGNIHANTLSMTEKVSVFGVMNVHEGAPKPLHPPATPATAAPVAAVPPLSGEACYPVVIGDAHALVHAHTYAHVCEPFGADEGLIVSLLRVV